MTLARKLLEYELKCTFFVRNISENLIKLIGETFEVILLNGCDSRFDPSSEYSNWLGVNQLFDAKEFISKAAPIGFDLVIIDHYGIGHPWEMVVKHSFNNILVIDDLANREHHCDILVDQSIGRKQSSYSKLVPSTCKLFIGPKFSLLRDEFLKFNKNFKNKYQILINFGGADSDNFTQHVVDILCGLLDINELSIKIIIGKDYPFQRELTRKINNIGSQIRLVQDPKNIAEEIAECEIAIGAGGVSLLERSSLGVPSILYAIAENQKHICEEYDSRGLGYMITKGEQDESTKLGSVIEELLNTETLYQKSKLNRKLVNVHGTNRVVTQLLRYCNFITSDKASIDDAPFIYDCRYKAIKSAFYINPDIPSFHCHLTWFRSALRDKLYRHIIFRAGWIKYGYVRLDIQKEYAEISIYVHPKYRGRGLGEIMLTKICEQQTGKTFRAYVHVDNSSSLNLFLNNGFNIIKSEAKLVRLEHC